jgi:peptidoglycan/LPS O-acetylase OafA/YrhL
VSGGPAVGRREALADAGLAALVLAATVAVAAVLGVDPHPTAAVAGGVGTLAFEAAAGRDARRVRRHWRRPAVKAAALALSAAAVAVGLAVAPGPAASAVAGALLAYLAVAALVVSGVVPPPAAWTRR